MSIIEHETGLPIDLKLIEDRIYSAREDMITAWRRIAQCLQIANEHRLFEEAGFSNFEQWVHGRFGWQKSYAYKLIRAEKAAAQLEAAGIKRLPETEREIRNYTTLEGDELIEAWKAQEPPNKPPGRTQIEKPVTPPDPGEPGSFAAAIYTIRTCPQSPAQMVANLDRADVKQAAEYLADMLGLRLIEAQDLIPAAEGINPTAWETWIKYRRERKLTLSDMALDRQQKLLQQFDESTQVQMVEQSIANGWNGLFPLKRGSSRGNEELRRWLE